MKRVGLVLALSCTAVLPLGCGRGRAPELVSAARCGDVVNGAAQSPSDVDEDPRVLAEIADTARKYGTNGANEAWYEFLVEQELYDPRVDSRASGDSDRDGRPEFLDALGNPVAVLHGEFGVGSTYVLADGTRAELVSFVTSPAAKSGTHVGSSLGSVGLDLVCTWQVAGGSWRVTYDGSYVPCVLLAKERFLVFPVRLRPSSMVLRVQQTRR